MDPITLLQTHEFERRLAAVASPRQRHLAELRQRRTAARRARLRTVAQGLVPRARRPASPQACGC